MNEKYSVELLCKDLVDVCVMRICVGTNTPMGGDAGHGGRTVIEIDFKGSCVSSLSLFKGEKVVASYDTTPMKLRIVLYGDAEARNIIRALSFASEVLKQMYMFNKTNVAPIFDADGFEILEVE